ncbi:hypothetical protein A2757_03620 [Candidatus Giovannonibacteria bacterium RIFCSPHIGHO2_01_FULL_48_47]|nr:MAG: hypothetical protein A2757_03620 [Candidatus Giovannonibacteria bacterium RIFCSPHIGHO2_01_FULL_48_47]OGF68694.1 MAG: hypothetical protein A3D61_01205 [Candidatus Giovannonibacteria bacterium RIFCSPHIGHO2_02_FULL_48_15]OGF89610.1 MAG: hypothetical protein A3B26_02630 [Candidatus Giovannonibacteria bacterium RIFCSPLOWO2_01_FULL_48_47]OGF95061.1 MAG: hypothetical protein A2433_00200 [Candidatus Giovannonibacteria bacterium RIFOXYC1_FULL_48_8]OGF96373.1 MAG: hypothetical protein A2613_02335
MLIEIFAVVMGILMSLGYYPQAYKIFKTKSADDISIPSFIIFSLGTLAWFIYGIYLNNFTIMISFILGVVGSWSVLILAILHKSR